LWNQVSDEKPWKVPDELANEFIKSQLNMGIIDDTDLKNRVDFFLQDKKLKRTYNNDLFETLRYKRQRELNYSFDFIC
jgi:very-short-patch-repair endonuclease